MSWVWRIAETGLELECWLVESLEQWSGRGWSGVDFVDRYARCGLGG